MARPRKNEDLEATADRILNAAEAEFGTCGFARARLEDVASSAGITRPSLLHHFQSKGRLYGAVLQRALYNLRVRIEQLSIAPEGFVAMLEQVTTGLLAFAEERPGIPPLVLREWIDPSEHGRSVLDEEFVPIVDRLEALVREHGAGVVPADFPVRDAVLALLMSH